jgi:hypothetical protein
VVEISDKRDAAIARGKNCARGERNVAHAIGTCADVRMAARSACDPGCDREEGGDRCKKAEELPSGIDRESKWAIQLPSGIGGQSKWAIQLPIGDRSTIETGK